jgi:hypothetical protein
MRQGLTIVIAAMLLVFAATACADILIKSSVTSKGLVGLTNMEGTTEQMIAGDKAKTVSNMKMTNKVMKFLGAGKPQESSDITRLDKELIWNVMPKDKEYTEMTFAELRAAMEKGLQKSQEEKAKFAKEHPKDTVSFRTEFKVEKTGKSQKIAGYEANETVMTMLIYGKNAESGEQGVMRLTMDMWLSKDIPGAGDFKKFYAELATKLGFTGHGQQSAEGMLTAFGIDPRELYKHTKDLEGMALMSTMSLGMVVDSTAQASKKGEVKEEKKDKEAEQSDEGGKGGVTKKLGGLFGKKKESKNDESAKDSKQEQQAGPQYLMQFTTTVTEISAASIPASEFEVPAGFKLKK